MSKKCKIKTTNSWRISNEEKKSIEKRKRVNKLYFKYGVSKRKIAREEKLSRGFVDDWTKSADQDFNKDERGWPKGKRKRWNVSTEKRIKKIRKDMEKDPNQFYKGATAVEMEWRKRYPDDPPPPLRTIGKIMSDLSLTTINKEKKRKGASRYLCYPEHTICSLLGGRVLEADFICKKYITGRTEPLSFIGFSFKKKPRLRYYKRVSGLSTDEFKEKTEHFISRFERPDYVKVDNCAATIGSVSGKRNISRTMEFLLENQIIPIFSVPRRPFTQASIEGNNSVFSRKFWNRIEFKSVEDVDSKLEMFNKCSIEYTRYKFPEKQKRRKKEFIPKVYFTRQVRENEKSEGFIDILHEKINLPKSYINYFVLGEWNLREEKLYIRFEKDKGSKIIKEIDFKINKRSKKRCKNLL